ncbi:MAG TPA: YciI family protein [Chitinophaga sp.]|uniref:YciI family protein n=1 Tax=Chitinophaga sp. TaxID=1869181 RepID=UPI002CB4B8C3|nr:YciI family protein [Chitinophaga sp.]HVI45303.1 YciI family protein [Chitinophaga sp.]
MKEFVLIFRHSDKSGSRPSPEQLQERMNWLGGIAAANKVAYRGHTLSLSEATTVGTDKSVTDGPYTEAKDFIAGFMIVKADTIEEAIEMAGTNPVLKMGGSVEVRGVIAPVQQ